MIKKDVSVGGVMVPFRASATIPRLYRAQFGRDIFKDLLKLEKAIKNSKAVKNIENSDEAVKNSNEDESGIGIDDLELFENVAYIMAKHADPSQPDTAEEWLDQFDVLSIYTILPEILELWNFNLYTDSAAKKKRGPAAGK